MFPLILTDLTRDYSTGYVNPYKGLLVEGEHPKFSV